MYILFQTRRLAEGRGHLRGSASDGVQDALAEQLEESMQAAKLTKPEMRSKMAISRPQPDHVSDPNKVSVQLDTVIKAARALGKEVEIKIKQAHKKAA